MGSRSVLILPLALPFGGCSQVFSQMWMGESPASLPPSPQPRAFSCTHSCLTGNCSSVPWATHPAASNKTFPSPLPASGKQRKQWPRVWLWSWCAEDLIFMQPGSVTIDQASACIVSGSILFFPQEGVIALCSSAFFLAECGLGNQCASMTVYV